MQTTDRYRLRILSMLCGVILGMFLSAKPLPAGDERSVYAATPSSAFTLYALDPDLLAGWNTPMRDYEKKFIPERYQKLPVLGGWYGEGFIPDREVLLGSGVRKAFYLGTARLDQMQIVRELEALGMDVAVVRGQQLADCSGCFRNMGRTFNRQERGEALARYAEESLARVRTALGTVTETQRPRVYIALDIDGLATVCRASERSEALSAAGAVNVHACPAGAEEAFLRISFEQLMRYDPDVILVYHPELMRKIPGDPAWSRLTAVREGRCHFIPRGPFSWLERPASFMRLLGVQWLANLLHPDAYPIDIREESRVFMKLFFNLELDEKQTDDLFEPYGSF